MAEYVHFVCTRGEAAGILAWQQRFWVSNCGCREERGVCARSRHDVCLAFGPGEGRHEISPAGLEEILREAEAKHLVMRPYRDKANGQVGGFCICCDDCCGFFRHPGEYECERGALAERTDESACTDCGDCAAVCFFGARRMADGHLAVDHEKCNGCGLCLDVCPAECIQMVPRAAS